MEERERGREGEREREREGERERGREGERERNRQKQRDKDIGKSETDKQSTEKQRNWQRQIETAVCVS